MMSRRKSIRERCRACVVVFAVTMAVSIGLVVGGFLVPPTGIIDGSVLTAVGELLAFPALALGGHAVTLGYDLKLTHGHTTIGITNEEEEKDEVLHDEGTDAECYG